MRVSTAKGAHDSVAHHSAVLIVCLQQQNNKLRGAAAGHHIALAQTALDLNLQVLHGAVQTAAGQFLAVLVRHGEDAHMHGVTAAGSGTRLRLIEELEEGILADDGARRGGFLPQLLPNGLGQHGVAGDVAQDLPMDHLGLLRRRDAQTGVQQLPHFFIDRGGLLILAPLGHALQQMLMQGFVIGVLPHCAAAQLLHFRKAVPLLQQGECLQQGGDIYIMIISSDGTGPRLHGHLLQKSALIQRQRVPESVQPLALILAAGSGAAQSLKLLRVHLGGDLRIPAAAAALAEDQFLADIQSGTMVNSGFLNGLSVEEAKKAIVEWLDEQGIGHKKVNYKLRDWVFSRQRYWGEPIPMVYCEHCGGWVPLPEDQLPLLLPEVESYEPGEDGESPLAAITDWVNTTCPVCGGPAKRETDTMPQWAGSSWYFLRYIDPTNEEAIASPEALKYWMPVDWYNGGMEHTTLHLLYSRFWHKFLYDQGVVPTPEPYQKRTSHGMILGENGVKMSKSRGNVVNPDDVINEFGADTMRLYEMFIGDFEKAAPWSTQGVKGCRRFAERVWKLQDMVVEGDEYSADLLTSMHRTIKKVSQDFEALKFNTGIAALMALLNQFYDKGSVNKAEMKTYLTLLNPVAPHFTEEMWEMLGFEGHIYSAQWPEYDEDKTVDAMVEIAVQLMGKTKCTVMIPKDADQATAIDIAKADEKIAALLEGKTIVKEIYVPGRIVNIVAR